MNGTSDIRHSFTVRTPLGDTHCIVEIDDEALHFESDDPFSGGVETLRWESISEGGTAVMAGLGGRGGPDLPNWVPTQLEWLGLSRTPGAGQSFMRALPAGATRDSIVAAVRQRLGSRWIGERMPLQDAQARLGVSSSDGSGLKVAGIIVAVLALLVLLIILLVWVLQIFLIPAGFVAGGWLFRRGLNGLRDGLAVANTPTAKTSSAALGLVELQGRACSSQPSPAGITGRPGVWWDVSVQLWYDDSRNGGEWRQVAARYGGSIDVVEFEDDSGRVPVWLKGADMLIASQTWDSRKETLPAPGIALLDELGFPWSGQQHIMVSEQCLEVNAPLYVLGTLDERRNVPDSGQERGLERIVQSVRTGEWRRAVVAAVPKPGRMVVAVLIGFLDMFRKLGKGGERVKTADTSEPPAIAPAALLVWKGRAGRPFLVSNRPEQAALTSFRRRSLFVCGIGAAGLCYTLYQLVELLAGA